MRQRDISESLHPTEGERDVLWTCIQVNISGFENPESRQRDWKLNLLLDSYLRNVQGRKVSTVLWSPHLVCGSLEGTSQGVQVPQIPLQDHSGKTLTAILMPKGRAVYSSSVTHRFLVPGQDEVLTLKLLHHLAAVMHD